MKIGVCWSMQLLDVVPTDAHDISLDGVMTEEGFIKTAPSMTVD